MMPDNSTDADFVQLLFKTFGAINEAELSWLNANCTELSTDTDSAFNPFDESHVHHYPGTCDWHETQPTFTQSDSEKQIRGLPGTCYGTAAAMFMWHNKRREGVA